MVTEQHRTLYHRVAGNILRCCANDIILHWAMQLIAPVAASVSGIVEDDM